MKFAELRIKIKSLAAESRIIRADERKALDLCRGLRIRQANPADIANAHSAFGSLHLHRTLDVRQESRAALLALAYLRGKPYSTIESVPKTHVRDWRDRRRFTPVYSRCIDLIAKYGTHERKSGNTKDHRKAIQDSMQAWFDGVLEVKALPHSDNRLPG